MFGLKVATSKKKQSSQFENPVDFFSPEKIYKKYHVVPCDVPAIIRCSWCKKYFCMHHFFEKYHDCKHYEI